LPLKDQKLRTWAADGKWRNIYFGKGKQWRLGGRITSRGKEASGATRCRIDGPR